MAIGTQIQKLINLCKDNMEKPEKIKINKTTFNKLLYEYKYVAGGDLMEPGIAATITSFAGIPIEIIENEDLPDDTIILIHKLR